MSKRCSTLVGDRRRCHRSLPCVVHGHDLCRTLRRTRTGKPILPPKSKPAPPPLVVKMRNGVEL